MSRSRLPLPPVPAARAAAPSRPAAPAPLTSLASYQGGADVAADDAFLSGSQGSGARADLLERPVRTARSLPDDESVLVSTGRSGLRRSAPAPRVPSQKPAAAPTFGDWTTRSEADDPFTGPEFAHAPGTTAIPERSVRRGRRPAQAEDDAPAPVRGPGTGPVGGRAAMRAERQAADAARRKAQGHKGSAVAVLEEDEPRKTHRVLKGLVAMTVVALGVLGVYSYVSPETQDAAAQTDTAPATTAPVVPDVSSLPELPDNPIQTEPVAASPVRVPVTVLNSTDINGLAAKVAATVAAGGWETPGVGAYTAGDVAASTVFFTEGDENQRQAALQLIEMFPQLQGPTARFFEMPAGVDAPGLVVVTTGDWQP
ncbi:LytR C-terminal domain-containing protein [Blastococcus litoris]|uniref:LytR C-terminal domain-containing protein n=1 Tax=Blastococcus litoris TaxID=2171622 RepID=UPI000E305563|nr:LytR C-terminal domain-containing protein [Blastococcus litoris]